MSIKSIYLSHKRLVELKDNLKGIDNELYYTLNEYLECNDDEGGYLVNVFNTYELRELEYIDRNFKLFNDVDTIYKAI